MVQEAVPSLLAEEAVKLMEADVYIDGLYKRCYLIK